MVVKIENLHKSYKENLKKTKVLKGLNIHIPSWTIYWFLWPNWSGKTTTLKCLLGFLKYEQGSIKVFDKNIKNSPEIFQKIWYAPENTYFYDFLRWLEFLIYLGKLSWIDKKTSKKRWLKLLDKLGLSKDKNKYIKSYSKWMKQRLGLAGSLINNPDLIFWDEPMSGLDPLWRNLVKNLMKDLKQQNKTIVFNTHVLSDVQQVADRFGILYDGQIIYDGQPDQIKTSLEDFFIEQINTAKQAKQK